MGACALTRHRPDLIEERLERLGADVGVRARQMVQEARKPLRDLMQRDENEGGAKCLEHQDHDAPDLDDEARRERTKLSADVVRQRLLRLRLGGLRGERPPRR